MKTLMTQQNEALQYAKDHDNVAFFMEMRLGKTLTAIRWIKAVTRTNSANLILTPGPVIPPWAAELKEDGIDGLLLIPKGSTKQKLTTIRTHVFSFPTTRRSYVLLNYEAITFCPQILEFPWSSIVCDESTKIRNPQARITKTLVRNTSHIEFKAILSGLPAPESNLDYFSQFQFLNGEFLGYDNYWKFRNNLFNSFDGFSWSPKPKVAEMIKAEVQRRAFIRTRKQCGLGSKKVYECRYVEMTPEQKKLYKQAEEEFCISLAGKDIETKWVPVTYEWMSQICGGVVNVSDRIKVKDARGIETTKITKRIWKVIANRKVNEIIELLGGELKGEKVVIWFKHNEELDHVAFELRKQGYHVGIFTSSEKFGINPDGTLSDRTDVMCAQPKCGLYGLDWSKASTSIYYSNWYDSEIRHQTEDRIIHPRKTEPVLYIDLLTQDSIDEDVRNVLLDKKLSSRYTMVDLFNKLKERKTK